MTFVPLDATQHALPAATTEEVMVALQKGFSVAVCIFPVVGWMAMQDSSMQTETQCSARP